ncbi:MAG: 50S ribosomal protein L10 [Thermostichales cyanobacterium SZTDM-1c_bins_54]
MGRQSLERKAEIVQEVQDLLKRSQMVMVVDYKGLTVAEMSSLRAELRPLGCVFMVVKNSLMERAIAGQAAWAGMQQYLAGSSAFIMVPDRIGDALKVYQGFQKKVKKTELRGAAMAGMALNIDQIKAVADLPPKEVLLAQAAGALQTVATRLAVSLKGVPTQLGRGINEVPASLGRVLQALAQRDAA